MIETIAAYVLDDKGITLATWVLSVVTALDAKVGVRIYTRLTVLIRILTPKVGKPVEPVDLPEPATEPHRRTLNAGHFGDE